MLAAGAAVFCASLAFANNAMAAKPCDGINRTIDEKSKPDFELEITRQLKPQLPDITSARILQSLSYRNWSVIHVDTQVSDSAFLTFHGSPLADKYLDLFAGAYSVDDEKFVFDQLTKGPSKGMPGKLARCFAWRITRGRG